MKYGLSYVLFLFLFLIDRLTKWIAIVHFQLPHAITSFLSFELQFNRGVSWGILHSESNMLFMIVTAIVIMVTIGVLLHAISFLKKNQMVYGHAMILAGALSNIIDRFMYGGVIDFIHVTLFGWSFPVFNVADMAIVCGVGIVFMQELMSDS